MNRTNRFLNRLVLFVCGSLLALVGVVTGLATFMPVVRDWWSFALDELGQFEVDWIPGFAVGERALADLEVLTIAVLILALIALLAIVCQARSTKVAHIVDQTTDLGALQISVQFAAEVLEEALEAHASFISASVSGHRVRGTRLLRVVITCKRGVSPRAATELVESTVGAFGEMLGESLPVLLHVRGGMRVLGREASRVA